MSELDAALEGLRVEPKASRVRGLIQAVWHWMPQGQLLPEHIWRRRHKTIVYLMWFHVVFLTTFGLVQGQSVPHMLFESALLILPTLLAGSEWASMKLRVVAASFGLITASAMLVHLCNGYIEAHFHFFVMIGVLTLYQDWVPFLVAIGYVVLHHGLGGLISPASVYSHGEAIAHPWRWALIHGGFVLAASAAHIVAWRTNENQLLRDPLTGLPSRLLFNNRLSQALERLQRRRGRYVAVLFLDLDRFKVINDSLGHDAGDKLLEAVADRLRALAAPARDRRPLRRRRVRDPLRGHQRRAGRDRRRRARASLASPRRSTWPTGTRRRPPASASRSSADPDQNVEELIRDADAAMYRAKEAGGGRLMLFDEVDAPARPDPPAHRGRPARGARARRAPRLLPARGRRSTTGSIVGVEALVRWEHPDDGLVGPDRFIALAEETGLIVPIGTWVLNEACRLAQKWQAERAEDEPLVVRVNVSARQLARRRPDRRSSPPRSSAPAWTRRACASRSPRASWSRTPSRR